MGESGPEWRQLGEGEEPLWLLRGEQATGSCLILAWPLSSAHSEVWGQKISLGASSLLSNCQPVKQLCLSWSQMSGVKPQPPPSFLDPDHIVSICMGHKDDKIRTKAIKPKIHLSAKDLLFQT